MQHNGNAAAEGKTAPAWAPFTFDSLLDEACERLLDRQLKYSVQRIRDLEKRLGRLESELDEFLRKSPAPPRAGRRPGPPPTSF